LSEGWASQAQAVVPAPARRGRVLAVIFAGFCACAIAAGLLLGGGGATVIGAPLAQAAAVTGQEPGFRYSEVISATVAGVSVLVDASGALNLAPDLNGSIAMTVDGMDAQGLIVGSSVYAQQPNSNSWLKLDLAGYGSVLGIDSPQFSASNPEQVVQYLRSVGSVSDDGPDAVDGVPTTHYHAVVDLARLAVIFPSTAKGVALLTQLIGGDSLPIDVWVDTQHRVRRFSEQITACTRSGSLTESITSDYYDFRSQPTVTAPPAQDVMDITSQTTQQLSQSLAALSC